MAKNMHAEIAGAGLAGLSVAAVLAQRGWSVTVHERAQELREIGAGIAVWQNGLWALKEIGAYDEATEGSEPLQHWELFDEKVRLLQREWMLPGVSESYAILRTKLHRALVNAAIAAGVEIENGSRVEGATPTGELIIEGGGRLLADLVVGADGVRSKVRDSLGLATRVKDLRDGCGRHLIVRKINDPRQALQEHWQGGRRTGVVPCAQDQVYVYLCCPAADLPACEQTHSREPWLESFPHLRDVIERIPDGGRWASFADVSVRSWSSGHVALVGDSAHSMSPNLGQAACVAMCNAVALGQALDACNNDVLSALELWQVSERHIADVTQRYSRFYGWIGTHWPKKLLPLRSALVWGIARSTPLQRRINVAAHHTPSIASGRHTPPSTTAGVHGDGHTATAK
jgi:2-polyprenyl-6-methoxyphenol hydroxylase-like FAD-dependent oxidoreductase